MILFLLIMNIIFFKYLSPLCSYKVELSGLGAEMRVEIKRNLPRSELKLGTLRVGETVTKTVPIVNRSAASAEFNLSIVSNIPELQAKLGFQNLIFLLKLLEFLFNCRIF